MFEGKLARGALQIVDTPGGERMQLTVSDNPQGLRAIVTIHRPGLAAETLALHPAPGQGRVYTSAVAPAEPHEFDANLRLSALGVTEDLTFHMAEPGGHVH